MPPPNAARAAAAGPARAAAASRAPEAALTALAALAADGRIRRDRGAGTLDRAAGHIEAAARRRGPRAALAAGRDLGLAGDLLRRPTRAAGPAHGQVAADRGILEDQRPIRQVDAAAAGRLAGAAVARRLTLAARPRPPRRRRRRPRCPSPRRCVSETVPPSINSPPPRAAVPPRTPPFVAFPPRSPGPGTRRRCPIRSCPRPRRSGPATPTSPAG